MLNSINLNMAQSNELQRATELKRNLENRKSEDLSKSNFEQELISSLFGDNDNTSIEKNEKFNDYEKSAKKIAKPNKDEKLWNVCIEMESIFVKQMLDQMKKGVDKGEFLHGGYAEEIFEDMLYNEYALNISKNGNIGIAKNMYDELSRIR